MTKREAAADFRTAFDDEEWREFQHDQPKLREMWNNYTDALGKAGRITQSQYDRWLNPFERKERR